MLEAVNIRSSIAVHVQIENEVQFAIASGQVKGGDQLPSMHDLGKRLGGNPNTVAKAYRDLEVMGYVYTRRGAGVFISKGVEAKARDLCRKQIVARLYEVVSEAKAAGMPPAQVSAIAKKSASLSGSPYGEVPRAVVAMAKGR